MNTGIECATLMSNISIITYTTIAKCTVLANFPNLNDIDRKLLINKLKKLMEEFFFIIKTQSEFEMKETNLDQKYLENLDKIFKKQLVIKKMKDATLMLKLLLPYISERYSKNLTKLSDIFNKKETLKKESKYMYSQMRYNYFDKEVIVDENFIDGTYLRVVDSFRFMVDKFYINWINVLPNTKSEDGLNSILRFYPDRDEYVGDEEKKVRKYSDRIRGILKKTVFNNKEYQDSIYFFNKKPYTNAVKLANNQKNDIYINYLRTLFGYTLNSMHWIYQLMFFNNFIQNRVIYLSGGTGSGKSSQIPRLVLYGSMIIDKKGEKTKEPKIIVTQPRIQPAVEVSTSMSVEMGIPIKDGIEKMLDKYNEDNKDGKKYTKESIVEEYYIQYSSSKEKHEMKESNHKFIKMVTDGSLINELQSNLSMHYIDAYGNIDEGTNRYDVVIIDEVHEHNANMDLILTLMKKTMRQNNSIRLVLISATLDEDERRYREFFKGMVQFHPHNIIFKEYVDQRTHIGGSPHPIKDIEDLNGYTLEHKKFFTGESVPTTITDELLDNIYEKLMLTIKEYPIGDILLFLVGERDIMYISGKINGNTDIFKKIVAIPFFGRIRDNDDANKLRDEFFKTPTPQLTTDKKELVDLMLFKSFDKRSKVPQRTYDRKIYVATNIAEASITIEKLAIVIDIGYSKVNIIDSKTGITKLVYAPISKTSMIQRRGRVGRTTKGISITYYDRSMIKPFNFSDYKITTTDIDKNILSLLKIKQDISEYDINWNQFNAHIDSFADLFEDRQLIKKNYPEYRNKKISKELFDGKSEIFESNINLDKLSKINSKLFNNVKKWVKIYKENKNKFTKEELLDKKGILYIIHPDLENIGVTKQRKHIDIRSFDIDWNILDPTNILFRGNYFVDYENNQFYDNSENFLQIYYKSEDGKHLYKMEDLHDKDGKKVTHSLTSFYYKRNGSKQNKDQLYFAYGKYNQKLSNKFSFIDLNGKEIGVDDVKMINDETGKEIKRIVFGRTVPPSPPLIIQQSKYSQTGNIYQNVNFDLNTIVPFDNTGMPLTLRMFKQDFKIRNYRIMYINNERKSIDPQNILFVNKKGRKIINHNNYLNNAFAEKREITLEKLRQIIDEAKSNPDRKRESEKLKKWLVFYESNSYYYYSNVHKLNRLDNIFTKLEINDFVSRDGFTNMKSTVINNLQFETLQESKKDNLNSSIFFAYCSALNIGNEAMFILSIIAITSIDKLFVDGANNHLYVLDNALLTYHNLFKSFSNFSRRLCILSKDYAEIKRLIDELNETKTKIQQINDEITNDKNIEFNMEIQKILNNIFKKIDTSPLNIREKKNLHLIINNLYNATRNYSVDVNVSKQIKKNSRKLEKELSLFQNQLDIDEKTLDMIKTENSRISNVTTNNLNQYNLLVDSKNLLKIKRHIITIFQKMRYYIKKYNINTYLIDDVDEISFIKKVIDKIKRVEIKMIRNWALINKVTEQNFLSIVEIYSKLLYEKYLYDTNPKNNSVVYDEFAKKYLNIKEKIYTESSKNKLLYSFLKGYKSQTLYKDNNNKYKNVIFDYDYGDLKRITSCKQPTTTKEYIREMKKICIEMLPQMFVFLDMQNVNDKLSVGTITRLNPKLQKYIKEM